MIPLKPCQESNSHPMSHNIEDDRNAKAALVIAFYHKLDPAFTRQRFLSFCPAAKGPATTQTKAGGQGRP